MKKVKRGRNFLLVLVRLRRLLVPVQGRRANLSGADRRHQEAGQPISGRYAVCHVLMVK